MSTQGCMLMMLGVDDAAILIRWLAMQQWRQRPNLSYRIWSWVRRSPPRFLLQHPLSLSQETSRAPRSLWPVTVCLQEQTSDDFDKWYLVLREECEILLIKHAHRLSQPVSLNAAVHVPFFSSQTSTKPWTHCKSSLYTHWKENSLAVSLAIFNNSVISCLDMLDRVLGTSSLHCWLAFSKGHHIIPPFFQHSGKELHSLCPSIRNYHS